MLTANALVSSTGSGPSAATITITGTARNCFQTAMGMTLNATPATGLASIQTVNGNVSITATGMTGNGNGSRGFYCNGPGLIQSTGAGSITILGNSVSGTGNNRNGFEMDYGQIISSGSGAVAISGVWGAANGAGEAIYLNGYIKTNNNPVTLAGDNIVLARFRPPSTRATVRSPFCPGPGLSRSTSAPPAVTAGPPTRASLG